MKKCSKIILVIVLVLLVIASALGITIGVISIGEIKALKSQIENQNTEDNENDNENVLIGGEYQIISTKHISDAYKSGDTSELNEEDKKTLEVATSILNEIIDEGMSDYEKEEAIYIWICENVEHDMQGTVAVPDPSRAVDRPIGVLQRKRAVCVGYATTFRLLVNMVGIDCMVMHDLGQSHSWNIVRLDDNRWYIVDCYMDADSSTPLYCSFNMDNTAASVILDWKSGIYPEANGTKYNYRLNNSVRVKNPIDVVNKLRECVDEGIELAYFEVENDKDGKNENALSYIVDGVNERAYNDSGYTNVYLEKRDDKLLLSYAHGNYEYDDGEDDDDDKPGEMDLSYYEEIDQLLNDIFGDIYDYDNDFEYEEYYVDDFKEK